MRWKILFLLAPFYVFSTVNVWTLRIPDNFTCYDSSDPAALNASLLYNDVSDIGELWRRDDLQKPLPFCSDIWNLLSDHSCVVCRDEQVFAVCQNLSESVKLRMEDSSRAIRISRCACDQLPIKAEIQTPAPVTSPTASTTAVNDLVWAVPTAVVITIITIAAFFICRHQRRRRQSEDKQDPEVAVRLTNVIPTEEKS